MPRVSPTLEGFRASFRRPSLTLAEIAWRWTVGAVGWTLILFWLIEFLDTLPVTRSDGALLSTRQPLLVGRVISHILRGSLNRAVLAALVAAVALSLLWIITASIGRAATVRALLEYFRRDSAGDAAIEQDTGSEARPFHSLTGLNFLRVAVTLSAILAFVGAVILAGFASPDSHPRPGLVFIIFLPLAGLICIAWLVLNWWLSLGCMFVVRDGESTLSAIFAAVKFFRERSGPVLAVSTWTGLAHLVAFSIATTAVSAPLAFIQIASWRLVIVGVFLVTLVYFAIVDWLYMARLGGYVCIAEMPDTPVSSTPIPIPQLPPPAQTTIDREETILSDTPNLAVQT
jgi:hypothetical protein